MKKKSFFLIFSSLLPPNIHKIADIPYENTLAACVCGGLVVYYTLCNYKQITNNEVLI
jgi:hypothetical protein